MQTNQLELAQSRKYPAYGSILTPEALFLFSFPSWIIYSSVRSDNNHMNWNTDRREN